MLELVEKRQENSKRFRLDSRREQLVVSIGAIHYKDNYADKTEQWKDIDLTWEGNKITKAPYELTIEGLKLTLKNKKTGEVSTIELMEIGGKALPKVPKAGEKEGSTVKIKDVALDTDLEIVADYSAVKFTRILKSDKAPLEAKFKVTGNFTVSASDEDGEIPVESIMIDGILTETLNPDRPVKYPIRIDPTWQVGASSDDSYRRLTSSFFSLTTFSLFAGALSASFYQLGGGMRFTNITIPQGGTILDGTHLTLRARSVGTGETCNSRISAEDVDDAITFANDAGVFDTRWAARTTARVDWDNIPAWTADVDYDSPEIKTVIKEIVDRGGWASGQDMVIFWEDFDDRSTPHSTIPLRTAYSYDGSSTYAPKLVITYTEPTGWTGKVLGVTNPAKILGVEVANIAKVNGVS